jgi:XTP/dITP diphosphohydrolase
MKKQLVFVTNNKHKLEEVRHMLGDAYRIASLTDIHGCEDIPETGHTLEENALIKAGYVWNKYGLDCFADDTGLEVKSLNNAPGVYSARYAGEQKNSEDNINRILKELAGEEDRSARFRTVVALILDGREYLFEGAVDGQIIREKRGAGGFGYDPVFVPDGQEKTFAELGNEVKNTVSHRAVAINKLKVFLYEESSK